MSVLLPAKTIVRRLLLTGVACAGIAGATAVGCSSGQTQAPSSGASGIGALEAPAGNEVGGVGTIGLALVLPGGDQINSVTYTLTNGTDGGLISLPTAANPGTVATSNSQSIDFQIGGIPAGSGDSITLSAVTTQGATCHGSATGITITARGSQSVTIQMLCTTPGGEAGNLFVTGATSYCGTWTALSSGSNGTEVYVGQTITLTATATGVAPASLGYTWSQASEAGVIGTFGATQSEAAGPSDSNTFTCTAPGTTTVTVVVDDGPLPDGGACPANLNTVSATVICDPNPANQGG